MKNTSHALPILFVLFSFFTQPSRAEVSLLDHSDWKVGLGGFIEMDNIYDTTRGLTESVGNPPVARKGTLNGENGRAQMSLRNSRLSFNVQAPVQDEWKTRGYLEADFLGYDPAVAAGQSESAFYSNPTLRIRHAYLSAEKNGWQIIAGQNWTLFGWEPQYVLATISVAPVSGTLYQRTPKVAVMKTAKLNESDDLQFAVSVQRPSQRDSGIPNVDAGIRWADNGRKSGFAGANGDIKTQPLSIGVSGTFREFSYPTIGGSVSDISRVPGYAVALDTLIPVIASSDGKDTAHTLTLTGEFSTGRGYGDEFPSLSMAPQFVQTTNAVPTNLNLDAGLGGYNNTGAFELLQLRQFNAQLQYHLFNTTFITAGYGQVASDNAKDFAGSTYHRSETYFANLLHDFTPQIRVGIEFDQFATQYSDDSINHSNRYMLASYFRF